MDKWFMNMAAGATLSALLVLFGTNTLIDEVYPTGGSSEPEPAVASVAPDAGTENASGEAPAAEEPQDFNLLLASASVEDGQKEARKCVACHGFEEGAANKVGPGLHGIVGRPVAAVDDYSYSTALVEYGGEWSYDRLDCFLENPKECVSGTKMNYAGISKDTVRADLIAYLRSISPNAPALPEPAQNANAEPAPTPTEEAATDTASEPTSEATAEPVEETPEEPAPSQANVAPAAETPVEDAPEGAAEPAASEPAESDQAPAEAGATSAPAQQTSAEPLPENTPEGTSPDTSQN